MKKEAREACCRLTNHNNTLLHSNSISTITMTTTVAVQLAVVLSEMVDLLVRECQMNLPSSLHLMAAQPPRRLILIAPSPRTRVGCTMPVTQGEVERPPWSPPLPVMHYRWGRAHRGEEGRRVRAQRGGG